MKPKQLKLLKGSKNAFGGDLFSTRKGRLGSRPISTRESMHLVLRSSKATHDWSFKKPKNEKAIREVLKNFSERYGVKIHSAANVGNHIHLHLKLTNRHTYKAFIRAITGAIAMKVTGINRWTKIATPALQKLRFWDQRPFTRVIQSYQGFLNLRDYIKINVLEGHKVSRSDARVLVNTGVWINTG